ncbi:unnamed protein product [Rotaria sordida]|uniref:Uncharacterized protein n=1 Tax=Rotaria sordida TaxID=392033 RepID=A0A819FJ75_9BILA|nr:unnamed protein product [Rotaria sordida]CAF1393422.1 unnamed protein product [Rotaria sordida]CAF1515416.1 unnamed protein product [Rotaria sordida]CAF3868257.1 unnamed protein product [Rotaria sordida]CAF3991259.1 unnamed protein product [Rotaria sordida]
MMSTLCFFILIFSRIHGKFLSNSESSSFIYLRHIRLTTDDQQYRIRCPYNLNYLNIQLLNYSNENCFNLYLVSNNNICMNYHPPCQFYAKTIQLHCNHHSYSKYVDITYQCSYKAIISSDTQYNTFTLHSFSFPTNFSFSEESIALFLIGISIIIIFWIIIFCICFIHYHDDNDNYNDDDEYDLLSQQSYIKEDIIDFNLLSMKNHSIIVDNLCLHVNPFENNHISSLTTT